ncbi:hypothetical protein Hanom_Chr13g01209961 [Helianthus anomalus]
MWYFGGVTQRLLALWLQLFQMTYMLDGYTVQQRPVSKASLLKALLIGESEEVEPNAETVDEVAEAVVTAVVGEQVLEKSEPEPLLEPLAHPWSAYEGEKVTSACENECDYVMMVAAKVSPQVLKNLCSNKCAIAFANIKEVTENLRDKILKDVVQFENLLKN